jgi:hypothetical protein
VNELERIEASGYAIFCERAGGGTARGAGVVAAGFRETYLRPNRAAPG